MSHEVFLSYSSIDKLAADAVCHGLEAKGIRCWIAPRDQIAGRPYGEQIAAAISAAQVMVLIFSDSVNKSHAVHNEVDLAANANVTIIPFRIAGVEFIPELKFYLGRVHWLDAFPLSVDNYLDNLAETVKRNLKAPGSGDGGGAAQADPLPPPPAPPPPPPPSPPPPPVAPPPPPPPVGGVGAGAINAKPPPRQRNNGLFIAGGVALALFLVVAAVSNMSKKPAPPPAPAPVVPGGGVAPLPGAGPAPGSDQPAAGTQPQVMPPTMPNQTAPAAPAGAASGDAVADPRAVQYFEKVIVPDGPPDSLAGADIVSTAGLMQSLRERAGNTNNFALVDARGCTEEDTIPGAVCLQPNSVEELERHVAKTTPIVVFCHDGRCAMSYSLAKAALEDGYGQVFWYRGGINAWRAAGFPTARYGTQ